MLWRFYSSPELKTQGLASSTCSGCDLGIIVRFRPLCQGLGFELSEVKGLGFKVLTMLDGLNSLIARVVVLATSSCGQEDDESDDECGHHFRDYCRTSSNWQ